MPITGMDIEAVRQLAVQMDNDASQIEQLMGTLTTSLEGVEWMGPDRERFVSEWNSTHKTQLTAVAHSLRDAAIAARGNADEQDQAAR